MTVHDDEWDMPFLRHGPTSSYNAPVVPPSVEPDGGTLVQIPCVAKEWLPVVLGALDQLRLPSTWKAASDDDMLLTLQRVANLRDLIAQWGACEVLAFRCEPGDDHSPQYSTDGGATWIDLPDCFIGPAGATGATGAAGATGATGAAGATGATGASGGPATGTPPAAPGANPAQAACNVSAFLTYEVLKASVQKVVDQVNAGASTYTAIEALAAALGPLYPPLGITLALGGVLVNAIASGTSAPYTTALANTALWGQIRCAIYVAIVLDGNVTAGNYATLRANVAALTWADGGVKATILAALDALGWTGLAQLAQSGGYYAGDCSACGAWCYNFDFTTGTHGFAILASGYGTYVAGVGFTGDWTGTSKQMYLVSPVFAEQTITSITWTYMETSGNSIPASKLEVYDHTSVPGTSAIQTAPMPGISSASPQTSIIDPHVQPILQFGMYLHQLSNGDAGAISVKVRGTGVCPFGTPNCV